MLTLNRLSQRERAMLVDHVTGGKKLPTGLLDQIVERTDGVPLFVEELTKSVLESEGLHEAGDHYVLDQPAQDLAIPTTLQASLMARVDRLGSAREVLQIGAAIGRDFSYGVLAAVAGLSDAVLQDALIRLSEAELVFLRGTPPNATYTFKHALIQDAAYSAMLRTRRQQLHAAIALVLEKRFADIVESTPEVIAQQFERAGQNEKAIAYWQKAAERDLRRFAMKELIAHYSNALRLIMALPDTPERSSLELGACLGLGLVQLIASGPSAKEVGEYYQRALDAQSGAARPRARAVSRQLGRLVVSDDDAPQRGSVSTCRRPCGNCPRTRRSRPAARGLSRANAGTDSGRRTFWGRSKPRRRSSASTTVSVTAITPIISADTMPASAR